MRNFKTRAAGACFNTAAAAAGLCTITPREPSAIRRTSGTEVLRILCGPRPVQPEAMRQFASPIAVVIDELLDIGILVQAAQKEMVE